MPSMGNSPLKLPEHNKFGCFFDAPDASAQFQVKVSVCERIHSRVCAKKKKTELIPASRYPYMSLRRNL